MFIMFGWLHLVWNVMWLCVIFGWVDCILSEMWCDYVLCLVRLIASHVKCDVIVCYVWLGWLHLILNVMGSSDGRWKYNGRTRNPNALSKYLYFPKNITSNFFCHSIIPVTRPNRPNKARRLGYKAKQVYDLGYVSKAHLKQSVYLK